VLGNIAIVLITAYHMGPDEEVAVIKEAQADLLLYKPLPSMAELRQTMNDVIGKRRKLAPKAEATPEIVSVPLSAEPTSAASEPDQAQPGDSPRAGAGSQGQTTPHSRTQDR
jgi:hypothetical protein